MPSDTLKFMNETVNADVGNADTTGQTRYTGRYTTPAATQVTTPPVAGPSTTAPSPMPVAGANPTPGAPAAVDPNVLALTNDPIANYYNNLKDFNGEADEQAIKSKVRADQQAAIDAIEQKYVSIFAGEQRDATGRLGTDRAINSRSGLTGSDFGAANTEKVTQLNKQSLDAVNAQKAMEVQSVYSKIDNLAKEEIAARKAEALGKINGLQEIQQKTRDLLPQIAKSAANLTPEQRKKLAASAGYDELTFDTLLNSYKNQKEQGKTEFKTIKQADGSEGLTGITTYADGRVEVKDYPVSTGGKPVKVYDGIPYTETRDASGNVSLTPVSGFVGKDDRSSAKKEYDDYVKDEAARGNKNVPSFDKWQTIDANRKATRMNVTNVSYNEKRDVAVSKALGDVAPNIELLKGPDRYVNPTGYKEMYAEFVKQNPGQGQEFLKEFPVEIYVNPKDRALFAK